MTLKRAETACAAVCLVLMAAAVIVSLSADRARAAAPAELTVLEQTQAPAEPGSQAVNINTAGQELLDTLPGIGPELAGRIIAYREEHGPFEAPADIIDVSGIGLSTFEKLKDKITV